MNPKPLSDHVNKGLAYLANQQNPDGGWSQGGGWRMGDKGARVEGPSIQDPSDVANTCVATMALLRAGQYGTQVLDGLDFIIRQVEESDPESILVTNVRGTQVQTKIGPYVDTFLASLVLAEARGSMTDAQAEARLGSALDKVIRKMERHQQADGTWAKDGWAPVVGQSLASAGLHRARQRGHVVSDMVLEGTENYSRAMFDAGTGAFSDEGTASVPLYGSASHVSASQHYVNTFKGLKPHLRKTAESKTAPAEEQTKAREQLKRIEEAEAAHDAKLGSAYAQFKDKRFVQGFGSNGGEEFLSYMNISETLLIKGGQEWEQWDESMTENLSRIQNKDGSWSGHHCITGRTFCTAAALLVLMADRAPRPEPANV